MALPDYQSYTYQLNSSEAGSALIKSIVSLAGLRIISGAIKVSSEADEEALHRATLKAIPGGIDPEIKSHALVWAWGGRMDDARREAMYAAWE